MSAALENMQASNPAHTRTESVDAGACIDVGKKNNITLDIRNLRHAIQDKFCAYDKITKSEVCSFDPDVVQDLSTKHFRTAVSSEHVTCQEEGLNLSVSSKKNKANGPDSTHHNDTLPSGSVDGAAVIKSADDVQEQLCTADSNAGANSEDCKGTVENLDNEQDEVCGTVVEGAGNIEIKEDKPEIKENDVIDTSNSIQIEANQNQKNEICVEKKPDLNLGDVNKESLEKPPEGVNNENGLEKTVKNESSEKDTNENRLEKIVKNELSEKDTNENRLEKTVKNESSEKDTNENRLEKTVKNESSVKNKNENGLEKTVKNESSDRNEACDLSLAKPGQSSDIQKQDLQGGNTFRCTECPWAFSSKSALQVHVTKKHRNKRSKTPDVPEYQNTRSKRASVLYIRPKPFQCTKCTSSFHKRKELKEHSLCHSKQNHLVCQFCGLAFSKRKDLNDHLLFFHDQKQQGAFCELCGKTFSQAGNLKIHLRIHTKEKPYTCEHCGKCYAQSGDLKTHVRVHTDERPYLCEFCGNLFHSLSHLGRHSKVHTKEKPYTCLVCGHSFAHAHHLKKHYRIHTKEKPYNCDTCGKAFARSDYLKQHIRVHTKEKPYICKICGKGFSQGGSLRLHQRVHARQGIL